MIIHAYISKEPDGSAFNVSIPNIGAYTYGETYQEAINNIQECMACALDQEAGESVESADITVFEKEFGIIEVSTSKVKSLMTVILSELTSSGGLSNSELARRLGSSSPNSVRQYLKGAREPGIEKLNRLVESMGYDIKVDFIPRRKIS